MRPFGDGRRDLVEMGLHGPGIGERHDESCPDTASRADRSEEIGALVALIGRLARSGSASRPLPDQAVLLADPRLVLEPNLDWLALRDMGEVGLQRRREVFMEWPAPIPASCMMPSMKEGKERANVYCDPRR